MRDKHLQNWSSLVIILFIRQYYIIERLKSFIYIIVYKNVVIANVILCIESASLTIRNMYGKHRDS